MIRVVQTRAMEISASRLPRWRGFNLLEKFWYDRNAPFRESDFQIISDWGFDFARLPMSYRCWASEEEPLQMDESVIAEIDQAIEWGKKYGVHVNLNLHRAPGYCVNTPPDEPYSLWEDQPAIEAFADTWRFFAKRYHGIPNEEVSFDLLNEPPDMEEGPYVWAMLAAIEAIREESPGRLIIVDGMKYGQEPVWGLVESGVGQSTRGYLPFELSHHKAGWVPHIKDWPTPMWPMNIRGKHWDRARLREKCQSFVDLEAKGVGVHVGEWGCHNLTPHEVLLPWMDDLMGVWGEHGWGWGLWNLRGNFGVLDSERADVSYEEFRGHQLDRKMLEILLAH